MALALGWSWICFDVHTPNHFHTFEGFSHRLAIGKTDPSRRMWIRSIRWGRLVFFLFPRSW